LDYCLAPAIARLAQNEIRLKGSEVAHNREETFIKQKQGNDNKGRVIVVPERAWIALRGNWVRIRKKGGKFRGV
jgi:hypothetical protein